MRNLPRVARWSVAASLSLGLLFSATSFAAESAPKSGLSASDVANAHRIVASQKKLAATARTPSASGSLVAAPGTAAPHELFANALRSYPPSCLNSPIDLNLWKNDPNALQAHITLYGDPLYPDTGEQNYSEDVVFTLFRVVCSGGFSATLLEIDRVSPLPSSGYYPIFPSITVPVQVNGQTQDFPIRLADDPNTFFAATYASSPLYSTDVYVLENYYSDSITQIDYNQAFHLVVDNLNTTDPNEFTTFPLSAYTPPASPAPLPISGYMSSAWYDPAHSGEGIMTQIYDNGDSTTRTLFVAWYTYDTNGVPLWLAAQTTFPIRSGTDSGEFTNSLTNVPVSYVTGGGFGGGAKATSKSWGTMSFQFPNCNSMTFTYNGSTGTATGPSGAGTRTWQRLANINNLTCQ